ncbi:MAG: hypothetical protein HY301_06595 [Verrucomicrobia bacterium]|nr:hypothetical protein [Verrucomicrobiota bacterium]
MGYDPNFPQEGALIDAAEFRTQFHALHDETTSIPKGDKGDPGNDGGVGPIGPPMANVIVDAVNTLNPEQPATVDATFDGTNVHLTLGLPRGLTGGNGATGATGNDGGTGTQGEKGDKGDPGEVSNAQLNDGLAATLASAAANSSANTNAVPTLDTPFVNDPATLADMELMRAAYNTLVLAQRR